MKSEFLSKEKVFIQTTKFAEVLVESNGYTELHENIIKNNIKYIDSKTYEIAQSGFVDFNQHLFGNINEMNSISCGIYLEKSLVTYRIFIWGSKGEGFEIFKHVLIGEEINKIKSIEDIKEYIYVHLNEFEKGIIETYKEDVLKCFEKLGLAIESRKLPLQGILKYISIKNNIQDFR